MVMRIVNSADYQPLGDVLSRDVALVQAASVLDVMMRLAVESRDTELMAYVHEGWVGIADKLTDGEEEETQDETRPIGFHVEANDYSVIQEVPQIV